MVQGIGQRWIEGPEGKLVDVVREVECYAMSVG